MLRLPIGAAVLCRDGIAGRLKYVAIDPDDTETTDLIVERGFLRHHDVVVPVSWVEQATDDSIMLNAQIDDLGALPEYHELEFAMPDLSCKPVSGHQVEETRIWQNPYVAVGGGRPRLLHRARLGVAEDEVLLRRGIPVLATDGTSIGTLDHLVVDPITHQVTQLVVRQGQFWSRRARIVPLDQVAALSEHGVQLKLTANDLERLPPYHAPASDAQIAASLRRALATSPATRASGAQADIRGGVVRLSGAITNELVEAARAIARRIRGVIGLEHDLADAPPAPPLRIGASVYASDWRCGWLDKVIVDPHARRVTHLVIRASLQSHKDRVIPIERVARVDTKGIHLNLATAELEQCPVYHAQTFLAPAPEWEPLAHYSRDETRFWGGRYHGVTPSAQPATEHTIPADVSQPAIPLRRGDPLFYNNEVVAWLDHVLFDPTTAALTHLVAQLHGSDRRVIVPAEWVEQVRSGAMILSQWQPDRPGVPEYSGTPSDASIADALRQQLARHPELSAVEVQVDRGAVRLSGNTPTLGDKITVERIAWVTAGVVGVENAIIPDSTLVGSVSAQLSADRRTAPAPIEVGAHLGAVTLQGCVATAEVKHAAEQIARQVTGVQNVINALEVGRPLPEAPVPAEMAHARGEAPDREGDH
jgi:osmotically-inducible protein OsmY/sporulation protein YlmC with PRC-barrel domain